MSAPAPITHPLLDACGADHGFGVRGWPGPAGLVLPRQIHGRVVARPAEAGRTMPEDADAVVSDRVGMAVGVITADCVPILVSASKAERVAAIHAGWRGLASGVIEATVASLVSAGTSSSGLVAVVGPHIGACCYEVDGPVREAFGSAPPGAFEPCRPGHWMLDLGALASAMLLDAGLEPARVGRVEGACTACDAERFESYRRDGQAAGRLRHSIAARDPLDGKA